VIVIGQHEGKAKLFGAGVVMEGGQLHFREIRGESSKITLTSITFKDGKPFYPDKNKENNLVLGQFYEWPRTYLFPF
jgi:hypothetical protein